MTDMLYLYVITLRDGKPKKKRNRREGQSWLKKFSFGLVFGHGWVRIFAIRPRFL